MKTNDPLEAGGELGRPAVENGSRFRAARERVGKVVFFFEVFFIKLLLWI